MRQQSEPATASGSELVLCGLVVVALGVSVSYGATLQHLADSPTCDPILASRTTPPEALGNGALTWGNGMPKFSVVMFADFQCESCHALFGPIRGLTLKHGGQFVLRHYPTGWHTRAFNVATAVTIEGANGREDAYRILTSPIDDIGLDKFVDYVKDRHSRDDWQKAVMNVRTDLAFAASLGTKSTPCILFVKNGEVQAMGPSKVIEVVGLE